MAEYAYQSFEAWNTAVKLAVAVGRLKVGSNLKAAADAQTHAFEQAGLACALLAEGTGREGGGQVGLYRDARGALAQCRSWLHVLAAVMNEPDTVFANELDMAEQCSRQVSGTLRALERPAPPMAGPPPGGRAPLRNGPPAGGPRNAGPRGGTGSPR
ncbi:MAG: hypothetical protein ACKVT1_10870 [Dehalococcoidia bacterium]